MNIEEIGMRIATRRKEMQYTQKQLADILNVSDKAVSKWERGVGCPDVSLLIPLSEALHIKVEELISGQKEVSEEQHKKTIQEIILYTKKVTYAHSQSILRGLYIFTMIGLFLASAIVLLVEYVMFDMFTWSLIATAACLYAWVLLSTLYFSKNNKIIKTVSMAAVGSLGLIYCISLVYFDQAWFINYALPLAICSGLYAFIVANIWMKTKINIYYKFAWTVVLSIPINVLANTLGESFDFMLGINVMTNILIATVLFVVAKCQERAIKDE